MIILARRRLWRVGAAIAALTLIAASTPLASHTNQAQLSADPRALLNEGRALLKQGHRLTPTAC